MNASLIGESAAFLAVLRRADKIAASAAPVLVGGETGSGKEGLARRLHDRSPRRGRPFIAVNCSALPAALLESELFGHVRGAFTGACRTHEGLAAAARGGTLFLDEIADLELPLQAKLLRFIESGEFRKVGSAAAERAEVRVVAATHRDLKAMAAQGRFREDLYYRLSVLALALPPLRARAEDIAPLARHFLEKFSAQEGRDLARLEPEALELLLKHPWPGNVRELQNALHRAVVLNEGSTLTRAMIAEALAPAAAGEASNVVPLRPEAPAPPLPLWQAEQEAIAAALRWCGGNIPRAAALLQVSPSTLYRRRDLPDISGLNSS